MQDEIEIFEKKKAYLVFGVISKDTCSIAQQIQANKEFETSGYFVHLSEKDVVDSFIDTNNFHPLCSREWFAPIKNKVIINLLEKTENASTDSRVTGIVIDGSFAVNEEVRKNYAEILQEQGYDLEIVPVHSSLIDIFFYGYSTGLKISVLYSLWKQMNKQFSRTYEPKTELPDAVVVCGNIKEPILLEIISSLSANNLILAIDSERNRDYAFKLDKAFIGIPKKDQFWSKIAYHYNVKLVIDNDSVSVCEWHKIDVPVISLTSHFNLEK